MQDVYRHEAMPYSGPGQFVPSCVSLAREGLDRGERLIILTAGEKVDAVRDELGANAEDITFVPTDEHGRNPSRITTMLHSFQAAGDGRHSLGVSETTFRGRSRASYAEAQFAEFVLNHPSLRSWPLSVVCLYDIAELDESGLTAMQQSHPVIRGQEGNDAYLPDFGASIYAGDLDPTPPDARRFEVASHDLKQMRNFVGRAAADFGIAADRAEDLVLAANEVVTNSLRHGGGQATLGAWFEDGSAVCEVRDIGHVLDPLAGRFTPAPAATSGRGLWLANHLCDLVQLRSSAAGTVVRMYVDR